ncbi:MAG: hypothetical protein PHV34_02030 [Verrucomicrobiae bacterium]|nr:hypothetical protein [Verrucomicrobiae bacterium]
MKKLFLSIFTLALSCMLLPADIIYPDGHSPKAEPKQLRKIGHAINNIITAPFEIPKAMYDVGKEKGTLSIEQVTQGLVVRGPAKMFQRLAAGVTDLFTFDMTEEKPLYHLEPESLDWGDLVPGYQDQFKWETVDTPAHHMDNTSNRP